ncbi:hypothetical protein [Clostridium frigoriphilum]|uniref:Uncharacterized protein n=1 Tax=Clostridium frigoriphilum TaxID=443253 RepID=A0ABU7UXZ4_9CLOT
MSFLLNIIGLRSTVTFNFFLSFIAKTMYGTAINPIDPIKLDGIKNIQ